MKSKSRQQLEDERTELLRELAAIGRLKMTDGRDAWEIIDRAGHISDEMEWIEGELAYRRFFNRKHPNDDPVA